jgi:hypothetical protein
LPVANPWVRVVPALPPLLADRPRPVQLLLAVVVPTVYGAVAGIFLGISEGIYLALTLAGILGAVGAGLEHVGAAAGALRGILAGAIFGAAILVAHEIAGTDAKADLPDPAVGLVVVTVVFGAAFAALGGWIRRRREPGPDVETAAEVPGPR